jgi:plastocyanin
MTRAFAFPIVLAIGASVACGGSSSGYPPASPTQPSTPSTPSTPTAPNTVVVGDNAFNPTAVSVPAGTTVTWKWAACDPASDPYGYGDGYSCPTHNVVFDDGSNLASGTLDSGEYKRTFAAAGTYKYHCAIHGASMSGQIVVQ